MSTVNTATANDRLPSAAPAGSQISSFRESFAYAIAVPILTTLGLVLSPAFRVGFCYELAPVVAAWGHIVVLFNNSEWQKAAQKCLAERPDFTNRCLTSLLAVTSFELGLVAISQGILQTKVIAALTASALMTPTAAIIISVVAIAVFQQLLSYRLYGYTASTSRSFTMAAMASSLAGRIAAGFAMAYHGPAAFLGSMAAIHSFFGIPFAVLTLYGHWRRTAPPPIEPPKQNPLPAVGEPAGPIAS